VAGTMRAGFSAASAWKACWPFFTLDHGKHAEQAVDVDQIAAEHHALLRQPDPASPGKWALV